MRHFKIASVVPMLFLAATQVHAAVPSEVSGALDDAKTDGATIGGIVLAVIVAIAAFKYIRRAL